MNSTPNDLARLDLQGVFEPEGWTAQRQSDSISRFSRKFGRRARYHISIEHPALFQDGTLFTTLDIQITNIGGRKFFVSKFGDLFYVEIAEGSSFAEQEPWKELIQALTEWYGFNHIGFEDLAGQYTGVHSKFRNMTWKERFFSPWI